VGLRKCKPDFHPAWLSRLSSQYRKVLATASVWIVFVYRCLRFGDRAERMERGWDGGQHNGNGGKARGVLCHHRNSQVTVIVPAELVRQEHSELLGSKSRETH
jgi:hypothetical protein